MTGPQIALVVLGAFAGLVGLGLILAIASPLRGSGDIRIVAAGDTNSDLVIYAPHGRARARIVLNDELGRVYRIDWRIGRERGVTYCPPTEVMVRNQMRKILDDRVSPVRNIAKPVYSSDHEGRERPAQRT